VAMAPKSAVAKMTEIMKRIGRSSTILLLLCCWWVL